MYIPFRKDICKVLKKILLRVEENTLVCSPAVSSSEGRCCTVTFVGVDTGCKKKSVRVLLATSRVEESLKKLNIF